MMKKVLLVALIAMPAFAGGVAEKKKHDQVEEYLAKGAAEIKNCGKTFKLTFDWKAFDSLPYKEPKDKEDQYGREMTNVENVGPGINKLCEDKDYKDAMSKISNVIYKPTANDKIHVHAVISGGTLTFENYSFGSSRDRDDYVKAAKEAL
ncbi:MAG: hypothetical protein QM831_27625 [Kofleriaceae bacterium]